MTTLALTSPYLGPRPFDDDDADRARFFARDAEADEIVALILGHTLTVVYAQSGAGKTSIFNAAVLPRLRSEGFATLPLTRVSGEIPDDLDAALGLNPYILNTITGLAPDAPASDLAAHSLGDYLAEAGGDSNAQVLVVDQFEEIFTQSTAEGHVDRNEFFSELADAIASDPLLRVVLVLREEYIAQLEPYARFFAERLRIRFRLERLDFDAALIAVTEPLEGTGCAYDIGVAERLVGELAKIKSVSLSGQSLEVSGGYVEPVQLQVACLGLWNALPPEATLITSAHLDKSGDVDEALGRFYDSVVATVVAEGFDERQVRDWFSGTLITPLGTRGTVHRGETTGGLPNEAVDLLEAHHLVRPEFRSGARWFELTHDRLVDPIRKQNKLWEKRHYSANPLAVGAVTWVSLDRDRGSLLRGRQLDEARQYASSPTNLLTDVERDFLEASLEEQGRRTRRRVLYFVTLVALAAAVVLALFASWQWGQTVAARNDAEAAKVEAQDAQREAESARARAEAAALSEEEARMAAEAAAGSEERERRAAEAAVVSEEEARMAAEAAVVSEEEARMAAEAAVVAEEEARLQAESARAAAEAALRTSTARLDLLNRIAQEPNTLGGSVNANETATHAINLPSGRDFLVASVVAVFADEIGLETEGDGDRARRADMEVTIIDFEDGRRVSTSDSCYCASAPRPADGLWVIEVRSPVAVTYEIGLSFDQPQAFVDFPPNGKGTGFIDKGSDMDQWRFNGEQGQVVTVEVAPTPGSELQVVVEVLDPAGNFIATTGSLGLGAPAAVSVEFPFNDEYVVTVQGLDSTGSYEIGLSAPPVVDQGRLTIGDTTNGVVEKQGETHVWRFESVSGTPINIQLVGAALVDPGFGFLVELEDPDGTIIGPVEAAPLIATIPTDGTYVIRIRGSNLSVTGAYELETAVSEIFDRGALTIGGSGTGAIEDLTAVDRWRFAGVMGEGVLVGVVSTGEFVLSPDVEVLDPSGRPLGGPFRSTQASVILPATGEYVIQVRGSPFGSPGSYDVTLRALPVVDRGDLALGETLSGSIDEASQRDHWRFVGSAGETITIDVVASPGSPLDTFVSLLDSSGAIVAEDDDGGVDFNSRLTVTIPADGVYVIEVRGFDFVSLGAYEVSIS